MTTWNYRVVKKPLNIPSEFQLEKFEYAIHEAYYDENDNINSITENPVYSSGTSLEELKTDCEAYMQALTLPVLNYDDIPSKSQT